MCRQFTTTQAYFRMMNIYESFSHTEPRPFRWDRVKSKLLEKPCSISASLISTGREFHSLITVGKKDLDKPCLRASTCVIFLFERRLYGCRSPTVGGISSRRYSGDIPFVIL